MASALAIGRPYSCRVLATARFRRAARSRLKGRRRAAFLLRLLLLAFIALGVIAAGSYRVLKAWNQDVPPSADQAMRDAATTAAAMTSANATFTTQVSGLTVMFGTVRERVTPARVAKLSMTSVDGAARFPVTEVVTPSQVYVSMPSLTATFGKPWLGVPVSQLGADRAMTQLYQTAALPTAEAALIGTATTEQLTGSTKMRGVTVFRYGGTINPAAALAELAPGMRQLLAPELTASTGTIRFTVWLDARHQLRKVQTSATVGGQLTVTTVVVTAVNRTLHITVPSPGEVAAVQLTDPASG